MAEAFDEWTFGKVPGGYHNYFAEWSARDVTDFVHRDRNHPSIVLWSAGNEIGEQSAPNGAQVLRRLVDIFHREDPTRPVTTGNDQIVADGHPATLAFLNAEDIVGYNYVDRWHERRELFADEDRHAHPDWRMIGTESGSIFQSFDERYSLGTDATVVRPNYTTGMLQAERRWKWVATHDYFAGDFMWTGVDYLGEAVWPFRGFPSGVLDITGQPKDSYYLYQSQWTDRPVLHLFPHWNWTGRNGQMIPVLAYTNCNSVELFLNGRSMGEKRLEFPAQGTSGGWNSYALPVVNPTTNDLHLVWDVPYEPGVLRAVGKRRDGAACNDEVRTAGAPAAIRLVADHDTIADGPGDVAHVAFEIVDAAGTRRPDRRRPRARHGDRRRSPRARQRRPARPEWLSHRTTARVQRPRLGHRAGDETRARARGRERRRPPLGEHHVARRARARDANRPGGTVKAHMHTASTSIAHRLLPRAALFS